MAKEDKKDVAANPAKKGKKGLFLGLIAAFALGGGGFYATYSGLILGESTDSAGHQAAKSDDGHGGSDGYGDAADDGHVNMIVSSADLPDITFVTMEPLVISLGSSASAKFLRFSAQLDVEPAYAAEIVLVMPRITDVLNTYLRAVSEEELAKPESFDRLRAQMLRRIQVVTGQGKVRDLLITEFVLG